MKKILKKSPKKLTKKLLIIAIAICAIIFVSICGRYKYQVSVVAVNDNVLGKDFFLTVDYAKTLEQMIADGKYDGVDRHITRDYFPFPSELIGKRVKISAKVFRSEKHIFSEDIIEQLDLAGYRPARLVELLAFGVKFPDWQTKFPILAFGSVCVDGNGVNWVPGLISDNYSRVLGIGNFVDGCDTTNTFLAVRK